MRHDRVHRAQPRGRLAQRAGRQQEAVAEATCIDHGDLDVAREAIVLQAVIEDDDVDLRVRSAQRRDHCDAVGAHPHRAAAAAGEHDRLVANLARL